MSQDKLYYVQYTGNDVVVLGRAGKFMPGTSAYLREADARAAAARGDFVVHGLDKASDASSPPASSSAPAPAAQAAPAAPAPSSSPPVPAAPAASSSKPAAAGAAKAEDAKAEVKEPRKEAAPKVEKQEAKQ